MIRPEPIALRVADSAADFAALMTGLADFNDAVARPDLLPGKESQQFEHAVRNLLCLPALSVVLAECGGVVMGGLGFTVLPFLWDHSRLQFSEIFWWVYPEAPGTTALGLIRRARKLGIEAGATVWAWERLESSPAKIDEVYRLMGCAPVQTTYMGVSQPWP